jgi:hypothetical protein
LTLNGYSCIILLYTDRTETQMAKQIISFSIPRSKTRAHRVLFAENTPFKPKVVELKNKYQRQPKHRKSEY